MYIYTYTMYNTVQICVVSQNKVNVCVGLKVRWVREVN